MKGNKEVDEMGKIDIVGSNINVVTMQDVLEGIEELIKSGSSSYICVSNVHTVVTGRRDPKFRAVTNNATMAVPDGMPLSWVGRHRGYKNMEKCSGPDIMSELFKISEVKGYTNYFYGGTQDTLDLLGKKLKQKYPNLKIVGMYAPPFRELSEKEDTGIIEHINKIDPDIIWVGLGAPKQEFWMANHVDKIKSSVILGVGAAFNFHAGTVKRAPIWMQKHGLEWLYRLCSEPKRLWKRYLVTNFLFVAYLVIDKFKTKLLD